MRKTIALLAAVSGGVLTAWLGGSRALTGATLAVDWPSRNFAAQFSDRDENDSATRLLSIVERFGDDFGTIRRGVVPTGFLAKHANAIRTLRAEIVSNPPPVWPLQISEILEPPVPPLGTHMQLFQLLAADAIAQHDGENERAAWTDLRAAWVLAVSSCCWGTAPSARRS